MTKTAILVVSFGTTFPGTRQKTIAATEAAIQQAYPDATVFRAFTSNVVIKRIREKEQIKIDTPSQALHKIQQAGFTRVLVQSLHIIPGIEYQRLLSQLAGYRDQFAELIVGQPLLSDYSDYQWLVAQLPKLTPNLAADEGVLFMGHGTADNQFTAYACLDHMLMGTRHYVGAVESYPDLTLELKRMQQDGIKKVHLWPLMLVAGNHATNDMSSTKPDSWRSQLEAQGFKTESHLVGLGELPAVQQRFTQHLQQAIDKNNEGK